MSESKPTSLGPELIRGEDYWELDLTALRIITGLSVLSKIISDDIFDKVENSPGDISILYKVNPNINPELIKMHIYYIQIYARRGIIEEACVNREEFQDRIRDVFGTFQRPTWAKRLHPEFYQENAESRALVFPFHIVSDNHDIDYQFILERVESTGRPGEYFFRLTIENGEMANLDLKNIPHVIIDDLQARTYISGTTRTSEFVNSSIRTA
jgi:hypothetical protein